MIRLLCVIAGYIFGLFQTGHFYGKLIGVDLRKKGSGNTGATNALRVLGFKHAFIIFFFDALKAFIPVFAARMIFSGQPEEFAYAAYAAFGVILGNDYPFFLRFRGGKGVAATAGWLLAIDWRLFLICLTIFFAIAFLSRYVSLASMITMTLIFIGCVIMAFTGMIPVSGTYRLEFIALIFVMGVLIFVRHKGNIKRLLNGTENRFGHKS